MEKVITFCFALLVLISACSSPKQQPTSANQAQASIKFDSIEKVKIDTLLEQMHAEIRENGTVQKIPYTVYDPTDTIYTYLLPENSARISLELNIENGIDWSTFYIHEGDLVYVRYRYFKEDSLSSQALEVISYLKEGEIIYSHQRGNLMEDGQSQHPGSIRSLPYELSKRTPAEIQQDYQKTWRIVLDQMKEHDMLPDFLSRY